MLYGVSMALLLRSTLGNMPWDVLHQGLARRPAGRSAGSRSSSGSLVLLSWIPLRQRPGLGTVSNVVVIGLAVDGALAVVPGAVGAAVAGGLARRRRAAERLATAAYIGVDLGPGPRDGLMTGLVRRTGGSVRLVRTSIEVAVVLTGWLLGGTLGSAPSLYAVAIGPLVQLLLPWVSSRRRAPAPTPTAAAVSPDRPTPPADAPPPRG